MFIRKTKQDQEVLDICVYDYEYTNYSTFKKHFFNINNMQQCIKFKDKKINQFK